MSPAGFLMGAIDRNRLFMVGLCYNKLRSLKKSSIEKAPAFDKGEKMRHKLTVLLLVVFVFGTIPAKADSGEIRKIDALENRGMGGVDLALDGNIIDNGAWSEEWKFFVFGVEAISNRAEVDDDQGLYNAVPEKPRHAIGAALSPLHSVGYDRWKIGTDFENLQDSTIWQIGTSYILGNDEFNFSPIMGYVKGEPDMFWRINDFLTVGISVNFRGFKISGVYEYNFIIGLSSGGLGIGITF